jgi:hypothetical protein
VLERRYDRLCMLVDLIGDFTAVLIAMPKEHPQLGHCSAQIKNGSFLTRPTIRMGRWDSSARGAVNGV